MLFSKMSPFRNFNVPTQQEAGILPLVRKDIVSRRSSPSVGAISVFELPANNGSDGRLCMVNLDRRQSRDMDQLNGVMMLQC